MKKELEINEKPPFTFLLYPAYRTSILLVRDYSVPWFLSSFVLFSCRTNGLNDFGIEFISIPFIRETGKVFKNDKSEKAINRIVSYIDKNIYVSLTWDESVVACRPHRCNEHYEHKVLIYGYDLETKMLNILGFSERNVYEKRTISFDEFKTAYEFYSNSRWKFFKWRKRVNRKFNYHFFKRTLEFYQDSHYPILYRVIRSHSLLKDKCFGMRVYDCLLYRMYQDLESGNASFSILKALTAYCEHKKYMINAFEYIRDNYCSNEVIERTIKEYRELFEQFIMLRNMQLKYIETLSSKILENEIKIIQKLIYREKKALKYYMENV